MEVSEARLAANRANGAKSKGPVTEEGKAISRRNGLKHGLTGEGIVLLEGDQAEVERRVVAMHAEMSPRSTVGAALIRKLATLSVRSERSAERENARFAARVRNAVDDFDQARLDRAEALFDALQEDPRGHLRRLRRMPEGVARLLDAWRVLRSDLLREGRLGWGGPELGRAAQMTGVRVEQAQHTRLGDLSNALWGDFYALAAHEGGDLDDEARREWARVALLGLIDAQIAELEAHRETLDVDRIEQDRREAPLRVTVDDSKEASLSRRYEADADRGFYRALKEFRQFEREAEARVEAPPGRLSESRPEARVGSSCEATSPVDRERSLAFLDAPTHPDSVIRGSDGVPLSIGRAPQPPR